MESETSIRLGAGTRGHQRYGFTINRALSDTVAARVALFGKNTDGYIINSVTGKDRGNEDSLSYRASYAARCWCREGRCGHECG